MSRLAVVLVALGLSSGCTVERAEVRRPPRARPVVSAEDSANVRGTLLSFAAEFEAGDLVGLERLFDPRVVVYESGHENVGWANFRDEHLAPELAVLRERRLDLEDLEMRIVSSVAWATFDYRLRAESVTGSVDIPGLGTAVLERRGGVWLITHLHLSASRADGVE